MNEIETRTAPGGRIVLGEPAEAYFADPAIGRTDLMTLWKSPAKYRAQVEAKARKADWLAGETPAEEDEL